MNWQVEIIPDPDRLYHRVHKTFIKHRGIEPAAFSNRPKGSNSMSVDWEKYATPGETRARARKPHENAVVQFEVGKVRALPGQAVEHSPDQETGNRAHSDVIGEKSAEVRTQLSRIYELIVPLEQETGLITE
jgi:hypothetical protein